VGSERRRNVTLPLRRFPRVRPARRHRFAALRQLGVRDGDIDRPPRNVDLDDVALLDERDVAAFGRLRADVPDAEAAGAAREASIGSERARFPEPHRLDIAGGVEHLLHAGSALAPFITHDDYVAGLNATRENRIDRLFLALRDARGTAEDEVLLRYTGGL